MTNKTRGYLFLTVGIVALFIFLLTWLRDGVGNALGGGAAATGIITGLVMLIKEGAFASSSSGKKSSKGSKGSKGGKSVEEKYASQLGGIFDYSRKLRRQLVSAVKLYDSEDYPAAIEAYGKLLEKSETTRDYCGIQKLIADAWRREKNVENELAAYHAALERDPDNYRLWRELGRRQTQLGMKKEAEESWKKDAKLSHSSVPYENLAELCSHQGRYNDAVEHARAALRINSRSKEAYMQLALAYNGLGDTEKVEESIKEYTRNRGDEKFLRHLLSISPCGKPAAEAE